MIFFSSFGQNSIDKELAETYVELADNLSNQDDYSGAISYYSKAIEILPNWHYPYFMRGNNKIEIKDYYGAISDFTKTIEIYPNLNAYAFRGYAKNVINDYYYINNNNEEINDCIFILVWFLLLVVIFVGALERGEK